MREFFMGWRRKAGLAILITAFARLGFSWRLSTWCFETVNGYETRHLWEYRPDWYGFILLTLLSACLILWKPRKQMGPDHA